jgi:23S rRNA (uracil1939-C5)-methyltransferase
MKRVRPPVEVTIDGLDGDGVATGLDARGRRWTLRGAAPGQTVLAGGRCGSGVVLEVIHPAADAVAPRCPQFGTCGGCLYQATPLAAQQAAKRAALDQLLAPLGAPGAGPVGAPGEGYGYRNRVELSFGVERYLGRAEQAQTKAGVEVPRAGRFLGFHGPGRFDRVVDAEGCSIASPAIEAVLARVRASVLASPFPTWAPREQVGFWRHLGLREGAEGVLVLVYTTPGGEAEAEWLARAAPTWGAAAVLWYTTDRTADAAVGELRAVLHGEARLQVSLGGVPLTLSPLAFFQVNPAGAEVLLEVIRAALRPGAGEPVPDEGGLLLDLYCGVGALGLALHRDFAAVAGVDQVAEGIAEAQRNAALLGVKADYRAGRAELVLPALLADHGLAGGTRAGRLAVLVDPPRGGLHPDALRPLAALTADVLVYVACRPSSLARDGAALLAAGWRCTGWTAVDLFPHTAHVEVVARFVRDPA